MKVSFKKNVRRYLSLIVGIALLAFAFNVFMVPNTFVAGGITGVALIMNKIYNVDVPIFILIINVFLLILCFISLGREEGFKALVGSIIYPVVIKLSIPLINSLNIASLDVLLQAVIGGLLAGIGLGLIFREGLSTGGTDIINTIQNKYLKIGIGNAMLITDAIIVVCGGLIFGIEAMAYSVIAAIIINTLSTKTMLDVNDHKTFYIRTNKVDEVKEYLIKGLKYDVTLFDVVGGFKKKQGKMLMTVVKDGEYYKIKNGILEIDPGAFITITNSYETANSNEKLRSKDK